MKRTILIGVMVMAALGVLSTGVAVAQSPQPPAPGAGNGNGRGPMRFFAPKGEDGPLHEYMVSAMADALGISADEFESRHEAGETAYTIALDLGFTADEIPVVLRDARLKALDAAVADGVITEEQSDWMGSRQFGMGSGNCDSTGHQLGMGMGGWRFQQTSP